jgi:sulfhydrogenase subunit beta (sulfur reductase)
MKVLKIKKEDWAKGLEKIGESYRLMGPVKDGEFHNFKELDRGELPDFNFQNTRLSPKSIVYPQSEKMFDYTLDQNDPDHDILKEAEKDYSPQVVMGIRPCDAKAFSLVKLNFDTPEYKDTYWLKRFESTTLSAWHVIIHAAVAFVPVLEPGHFILIHWIFFWCRIRIGF